MGRTLPPSTELIAVIHLSGKSPCLLQAHPSPLWVSFVKQCLVAAPPQLI